MRILFIGKSHLRQKAKKHPFYDTRFYNGLIRNNHWVYFFSPKEEQHLAFPIYMGRLAKQKVRQNLLDTIKAMQPDALVYSHANILDEEMAFSIKKIMPAIRIAHVNVDAFFSPVNYTNLMEIKKWADCIFMTTGGTALKELNDNKSRAYFIPNVTDKSIDTGCAFLYDDLPYDLSCFMSSIGHPVDHRERLDLIERIDTALPELRTFYTGFNQYPTTYGADYIDKMGQSSMSLNLNRKICDGISSTPQNRFLYSSDRIAHIMGNGSLAFVQNGFELSTLYTKDEIVFFDDADDLIAKVNFYKNNPKERKRIAKNGWQKAHHHFNEQVIMRYIIETLFDETYSQDYIWKNL